MKKFIACGIKIINARAEKLLSKLDQNTLVDKKNL